MKPKTGYLPEDAFFPFDGLDILSPTTQLAPGASPNTVNMSTFRGSLKKRAGYGLWNAATINSGAETVLKVINFQRADGTNLAVAFTGTKMYYNNSGTWTDISTKGTIVTLPKVSGGNGWSITGGAFTVGDFVKQATSLAIGQWLTPDSSNYYLWVHIGVFDATNDITTAPTQNAASPGTLAKSGSTSATTTPTTSIPLTATEDNFIDTVEVVDTSLGRLLVMTNGVDWPVYWNGIAANFLPLPINLTDFCVCRCVGTFNSYLILGNIRTTVDHNPRTVVWSDTGNVSEWLAGNAGILTELSFQGELLRLIPFNDQLIAFARNSIGCICYIDSTVIFGSKIYVTNTHLASPLAVTNVGSVLMYVSQDNVYSWSGGSFLRAIGDKIAPLWVSLQTVSYINRTILFYNKTQGQVLFVVPTGASTSRTFLLEMDAADNTMIVDKPRWFEWSFHERPTTFGTFANSSSVESYSFLLLGTTAGRVMIFSGSDVNDNGNAIPITYETLDFTPPQAYQSILARWLEFEFEGSGDSIVVSYSTDHGSTWTALAATTLTSALAQYRCLIDVTSRFIRFKFTSSATGSSFVLTWYRVWLRGGGAR